jgi:hypothetical protein
VRWIVLTLGITWASPWTLFGLAAGLLTGDGRRSAQLARHWFHGGWIDRLAWVPISGSAAS